MDKSIIYHQETSIFSICDNFFVLKAVSMKLAGKYMCKMPNKPTVLLCSVDPFFLGFWQILRRGWEKKYLKLKTLDINLKVLVSSFRISFYFLLICCGIGVMKVLRFWGWNCCLLFTIRVYYLPPRVEEHIYISSQN